MNRKVIVIGGGVIGLAVAERLTRDGFRVELFERNAEVGAEASGAAAGILSPQAEPDGPDPFWELLAESYREMPETVRRLESISGIRTDFRTEGMIGLAFTAQDEADLERALEWQVRAGVAVERMTPQQVRREEPAVSGPVRSAVLWRDNGQIHPGLLSAATRGVMEKQGGVVRTSEPVERLVLRGNRVIGVQSCSGETQADAVVDCAGSWAGRLGLPFGVPVVPIRGQICQFALPKPPLRRVVHSPRAYLVQRADGKLIAGTTVENAGFDRRVTAEGQQAIRAGIREICPEAAGWNPETSWAGLRPGTPDHLPILGSTPVEGLWVATGHYRNGILLAPITARLIADGIAGRSRAWNLEPFGLSRFLAKAVHS